MRRKGERLTERTEDRTANPKTEWRSIGRMPGRDTLAELAEQQYQELIDLAFARLCARYGMKKETLDGE